MVFVSDSQPSAFWKEYVELTWNWLAEAEARPESLDISMLNGVKQNEGDLISYLNIFIKPHIYLTSVGMNRFAFIDIEEDAAFYKTSFLTMA